MDEERSAGGGITPTQPSPIRGEGFHGLTRVEPGYRSVLRVRIAIFWTIVSIGALVLDQAVLFVTPFYGILSFVVPLIALLVVTFLPAKRYRRLGYAMHTNLLQVVRGWLIHTDTLVPFVRVQHIDVTRGPLDKAFGTATLVVHTAGTHNSIVTLPGLAPERASAIRDEIRQHIRTDFE